MSLRLGARFGSMFREVPAPTRARTRAKARSARNAPRPRGETRSHLEATRAAPPASPRGQAVTYTIGELVTEAYARASRVTSDPEIEAILATRLVAAWLARSTLCSRKPASASREADALSTRPAAGRQVSVETRRSRTARNGAHRADFVGAGHAHRAVA